MTQPRKIRSSRQQKRDGIRSTALVAGGSLFLLLLGFAAGWFGRSLVAGGSPETVLQTQTPLPVAATDSPDQQATREALMQTLVSRVRHWRGAANAPVTLLDFSDFQ